jgi:hypothetical protein
MEVPEDVGLDGVEAHGTGLAQTVAPVGAGHARIVDSTGDDLEAPSVEFKVIAGGAEGVSGCGDGRLRVKRSGCGAEVHGQSRSDC